MSIRVLPWKKQEMSNVISESRASVQWRIKDFPRIDAKPGDELMSGTFQFLSATWNISMHPNGEVGSNVGDVCLFLCRNESSIPAQNVKLKFFYRDNLAHEYHSSEYFQNYDSNEGYGPNSGILREDLLNGHLRELLLKDDVLTVCCEVRDADAEQEEDAMEGVEISRECCDSEYKKIVLGLEYIYENSHFADVMLRVDGEEYPAHKAILASRSSVFRGMFRSDMKENRERVVQLQEIKVHAAREMLRYMYTGKVEGLNKESAVDLYVAGDRYDLQGLKKMCQIFLSKNIGVDNVCHVALMADLHSDNQLKTAVAHFLHRNLEEILASDTWKEFANEKPAFFLELVSSVFLKFGRVNKKESS